MSLAFGLSGQAMAAYLMDSYGNPVLSGYGLKWNTGTGQRLVSPITPSSEVQSANWIVSWYEWYQGRWKGVPSGIAPEVPVCAPAKDGNLWLLRGDAVAALSDAALAPAGRTSHQRQSSPPLGHCRIPLGSVVVFPVASSLAVFGKSYCDNAVKEIRNLVDATVKEAGATIEGEALEPASLWRNASNACFPLWTPLSGFSVQVNESEPAPLQYAYADGRWVALKLTAPGKTTIAIRNVTVNGNETPRIVEALYELEVAGTR